MIIPGYSFNPYKFDIGDILQDCEDGGLYVLTDANYAYAYLYCIASTELEIGQEYTARTLNSEDEHVKVGSIGIKAAIDLRHMYVELCNKRVEMSMKEVKHVR